MGLDMYLKCNHKELTEDIVDARIDMGHEECGYRKRFGTICYWRKANAIHKWFVDNVQDGNDDCGLYKVELNQLAELRDTCRKVLDYPIVADELLPTCSGFFFGGTEYDEYYFGAVKETLDTLDFILSKFEKDERGFYPWDPTYEDPDWYVRFEYTSSW